MGAGWNTRPATDRNTHIDIHCTILVWIESEDWVTMKLINTVSPPHINATSNSTASGPAKLLIHTFRSKIEMEIKNPESSWNFYVFPAAALFPLWAAKSSRGTEAGLQEEICPHCGESLWAELHLPSDNPILTGSELFWPYIHPASPDSSSCRVPESRGRPVSKTAS